jgi:hypothetical protein
MEVSGHLHAPAPLPPAKELLLTHWLGDWYDTCRDGNRIKVYMSEFMCPSMYTVRRESFRIIISQYGNKCGT